MLFGRYDNCHTDGSAPEARYPPMRDALNATGRPVLYSVCEWGLDNPATWAPGASWFRSPLRPINVSYLARTLLTWPILTIHTAVANSWRTTPDIRDEWRSVLEIVEINGRRWRHAGPGAFNDPDMLEVGGPVLASFVNASRRLLCVVLSVHSLTHLSPAPFRWATAA